MSMADEGASAEGEPVEPASDAQAVESISDAQPIRVADLSLDLNNPRHPEQPFGSDAEALEFLVDEADANELVQAIGNTGWLNYEPLVVLREGNVVLEGNRRLAALRILRDSALQHDYGITPPTPLHANAIPDEVLAIKVSSPSQARDFIGFKHVNGPHKWDSLAKAKFAWDWVRDPSGLSLDAIAKRLGDSHNTVARLVNAYIVLRQAQKLGFDIAERSKSNFSFSHLYTALPRPNVRAYLGLDEAVTDLLPDDPVPAGHHESLLTFMTLLYGQGARKTVIQSQNPNLNQLVDVLGNQTATAMLVSDRDLKVAYEQVEDRSRRFAERLFALNKAARAASEAAGDYAYDADLHEMAISVQKTVRGILTAMTAEKDTAEAATE